MRGGHMTINKKKLTDQEMEELAKETLNYNDRLDGYGFGEADEEAEHEEFEKGHHKDPRYGAVDQYSFRESPLGKKHERAQKIKKEMDANP